METSKTILVLFFYFVSIAFVFGQSFLTHIGGTGDPSVSAYQTHFSDSYCSINGPLVAEHDPSHFAGLYSDVGLSQEIAAPFTAIRNMILNQICIVGGYSGNCSFSNYPDYKLTIYSDNNGTVGNVIADHILQGTNVLTGEMPFGFVISEMGVTLDFPNLKLTSGTKVWFSVVSTNTTQGCAFYWKSSPTGYGSENSHNGGAIWNDNKIVTPDSLVFVSVAYYLGEVVDPSIPTITEWGLISLSILLVIIGIVAIKERQLAY